MKTQQKVTIISIILKAFDHKSLDLVTSQIIKTIKRTGADFTGPVPLPISKKIYTVIRGPHIHKTGREQFEHKIFKRLVRIKNATPMTMTALEGIAVPPGLEVEVKVSEGE